MHLGVINDNDIKSSSILCTLNRKVDFFNAKIQSLLPGIRSL